MPDFLAGLSVDHLPVSRETRRRLGLFGLATIGQVAALPQSAVMAQFGPEGHLIWNLANGRDDAPLVPRPHRDVVTAKLALPAPVATVEPLVVGVRHLLQRLVASQAFRYRAARGLVFRAMLANGGCWERPLTFREPLASADRMLAVLRAKLEGLALPAAVEEIELTLTDLGPEGGVQGDLLWTERRRQQSRLDQVVRQLKARYGRSLISKIVEVEPWSRIPERRLALIDYDP